MNKCEQTVYDGRWLFHKCTRKGAVCRDGKWYCGQHDPDAITARREKRQAKWEQVWREKNAIIQRRSDALTACANFTNPIAAVCSLRLVCEAARDFAVHGSGAHDERFLALVKALDAAAEAGVAEARKEGAK